MSPRYPSNSKYRADIDGLRAIAILSVLAFHAFPGRFEGGYIGVDIFFVISGFLISNIILVDIEGSRFSFIEFYSRRIKRIFPALALVLLATYGLGWFVLLSGEYKQLGKHIAGGAVFASNLVLWNDSGYFDSEAVAKPLLHLWSLGIEEQFYIVWPLLLFFSVKSRLNLLAVIICIGIISFLLNVYVSINDPVAAFYSPQTRIWELLLGAVLASSLRRDQKFLERAYLGHLWSCQKVNRCLSDLQSVVGVGMIGVSFFVLTQESQYPGWWALLPTVGTALIILSGTKAWINRVFLSNRILVWFGLISYPLYLWHWPIFSFANIIESSGPSRQFRIAAVFVSIIFAWITWKLIEIPIRHGTYSRTKTIALLSSMVLVGCLGYDSYKRDGIESRFPEIVRDLVDYRYDFKEAYRTGTCLLNAGQEYTAFDLCESRPGKEKDKTLLLWGDSHAAHLYPGFNSWFGDNFEIIQRTASLCPPILGVEIAARPNCNEINNRIFQSVKKKRPSRVVLAANWWIYDWREIKSTVSALQSVGVREIDLIGVVPQWPHALPRHLLLHFQTDKFHRIPKRMKFLLMPKYRKIDKKMAIYASNLGINFISLTKILCDKTDCLVRLGRTGETLTVWDQGHLTDYGSRFVVEHFPDN